MCVCLDVCVCSRSNCEVICKMTLKVKKGLVEQSSSHPLSRALVINEVSSRDDGKTQEVLCVQMRLKMSSQKACAGRVGSSGFHCSEILPSGAVSWKWQAK